ncbi:MAG TPA: VWA domain-containing protein [Pirellulales bacterium]|jgi:Flp pilus assembly protein TadG
MRLLERIASGRSQASNRSRRKGAIAVLAAIFMVVMLGMVAFSVDVGYIANTQAELQRACDASALAAAGALVNGNGAATTAAQSYLAMNNVAGRAIDPSNMTVNFGLWNTNSFAFTSSSSTPSAVQVTLLDNNESLFFGRVLNKNSVNLQAKSVAMYQPRDIMLVLDFSASMAYDSQFRNASTLGLPYVQSCLQQMYQDMHSPVYGTLQFTPQYATITGMTPTNGNMAQIVTQVQDNGVQVTSTKSITQVKLQFTDGSTQTIKTSGTSGTFNGTGANASKIVETAWIKSGTNDSGNPAGSGERFGTDSTTLMKAFGLTNVTYPYSGDSWANYFSYVQSDSYVQSAGYANMYGYMTWINYLQANQYQHNQTPILASTHEQPVGALKDSVANFMSYITAANQDDRIGLSIYTYSDQTAILESALTANYTSISNIVSARQAGHYTGGTNIYNGLQTARTQLQNNARPNAFKMVVLMTDGVANLPGSTSSAKSLAIQEANAAATAGYPVVTISMGALADTSLMSQIASITSGVYFDIPGGQTAAQYSQQLQAVWKQVCDNRPLKIVQ